MNPSTPGRFFAIGVGPGDPELLTLKAVALLQQAHAIYHAGPEAGQGRALDIVRRWLRPEQRLVAVRSQPMQEIRGYRQAVELIAADCRAGRDVAFICEGDSTLYSTASGVWQELAEYAPDVPIEVVPGVSAVCAAAARVQWPLAQKEETVAIVPAHYHGAALANWIEIATTTVFLKPAGNLAEIQEAAKGHEAVYIENVATPDELVSRDLAGMAERREYFSLVLVKRGNPPVTAGTPGISVVGIGPGSLDHLTAKARQALQAADVVIGYDGYLRQLASLGLRGEMVGRPLGAERERAREAVERASRGQRVAVVSSGDAGVYGMASLLMEVTPADVSIEVIPGVTAATAAAALLGAPLGHDFACISLSDLLTPWPAIEKKLDRAAAADFILALYNPTSQKRTWQLGRAREILLRHRRPDTPVGCVDRAYRPGQSVRLTTLGELSTAGAGMETIVIVGNSQTRVLHGRMVTPRGYDTANPEPESGSRSRHATPRIAGAIMTQSFAIIERELGPHDFPPWLFAVIRRMIHASADFDYARTGRHSPGFDQVFRQAWEAAAPIVTDVEMVRQGIASTWPDLAVHCHLNDAESAGLAQAEHLTRTAAGMRLAARQHRRPILIIGNAPTAIDETLRLVEAGEWQPAAIVGLPVGFVGVAEAKARLLAQSRVPYLTCEGRKGGSAVAAAAVNALIDWVLHER